MMIQKKHRKIFYMIMSVALIFLIGQPAFAGTDAEVTVTIGECLSLEYVPRDGFTNHIVFNITLDDLIEESVGMVNTADINWTSCTDSWKVTVHRDPWTVLSGSPDFGWYLQIKWGPPENDNWYTIPIYPHLDWFDSMTDLEPGYRTGYGTIPGIDWKIKELLWEWSPPGSYWTTVYFTIEAV